MKRLTVLIAAAAAVSPIAAFAATPPTPPSAQDARDAADMARVADTMRNPAAQTAMADAMAAMIGAVLDMPAAPFLKAADAAGTASGGKPAARTTKRDARLRDLAGADAQDTPKQVARAVPVMMGGMAGMTEAMGKMLPQLREMGETMSKAMGQPGREPEGRSGKPEPAAGTAQTPAT